MRIETGAQLLLRWPRNVAQLEYSEKMGEGQLRSKSQLSVPIESPHATSY